MPEPNTINVLYYAVGKDVARVSIANELEELQRLVGGYIECVGLLDDVVLICNEEGKLDGLPPNRRISGDMIVGDFLIVGQDGEDFADLSEDQIGNVLSLMEGS